MKVDVYLKTGKRLSYYEAEDVSIDNIRTAWKGYLSKTGSIHFGRFVCAASSINYVELLET